MFENLSLPHLLMVVAVVLVVFGPKRIPEIAGSMGRGIREFKKSVAGIGSDATSELSDAESSSRVIPTKGATTSEPGPTVPAGDREPKRLLR